MSDERERVTAYVDGVLERGRARGGRGPARGATGPARAGRVRARPAGEAPGAWPSPSRGRVSRRRSGRRSAPRDDRRPRARCLLPLAAALLARASGCAACRASWPSRWRATTPSASPWREPARQGLERRPRGGGGLVREAGHADAPAPRRARPTSPSWAPATAPWAIAPPPTSTTPAGRSASRSSCVPGPLRFDGPTRPRSRGQNVRFLRSAGVDRGPRVRGPAEAVDAFAHEFEQSLAQLEPAAVPRLADLPARLDRPGRA